MVITKADQPFDKLIAVGRLFFATALLGLAIQHFMLRDFVTGRAPAWPESIPGGVIWAYLTGIAFILVSAAILSGKHARPAAILAAGLIAFWALLRHMPVVAADSFLLSAWTRAGKALTLVGGAVIIAATSPTMEAGRDTPVRKFMNLGTEFVVLGRMCLGLFLVITGIQHFMFTAFVASLIPRWFPGDPVFWTYAAGVALIAFGIGLFIPHTARLAALLSGLMVFSWVWIVHLPRTFLSVSDGLAVFEALAVSGIALVVAGYRSRRNVARGTVRLPAPA